MVRIVIIRHLPTDWNRKGLLQGTKDIPIEEISERIRLEIKQNSERLRQFAPYDFILASSLKRTQQTAEQYGFSYHIEPLLNELDFGIYEGKPKTELWQQADWLSAPQHVVLGESLQQLEQRLLAFLKKYDQAEQILLFGHGAWIRALLSLRQFGSIAMMNKLVVRNNELRVVTFTKEERNALLF